MRYTKLLLTIWLVFVIAKASFSQDSCNKYDSHNILCTTLDQLLNEDSALLYETKSMLMPWKNVHRFIDDVKSPAEIPDADVCAHDINCWRCDIASYRLPKTVIPVHYYIDLIPHVDADTFTFDGEITVAIKIRCATRYISLHSRELIIDETATTLLSVDATEYKPKKHFYHNETYILVIYFGNDELAAGSYILKMKFSGIPSPEAEHGLFRIKYENSEGLQLRAVATHLDPVYARKMFPCWDEPAFQAIFEISIKHYRDYEVLSNMNVQKKTELRNNMKWSHFFPTPVMSTYLLAIAVLTDYYIFVSNQEWTINVRCKLRMLSRGNFVLNVAKKSKIYLNRHIVSRTNVHKLNILLIRNYPHNSMGNWGLHIYRELFVDNNKQDNPQNKFVVEETIIHNMIQNWFGNSIVPSWWTHVWLKKGLTRFISRYIMKHMEIFDTRRLDALHVITDLHKLFDKDNGTLSPMLSEVNTEFEINAVTITMEKVFVILRMLEHIITERIFRASIITFLETYENSLVTSDDFWASVQTSIDESDVHDYYIPPSDYKIKEVIDTWTKQKRFPLVTVTRNYKSGLTYLTQKVFRLEYSNDIFIGEEKWWIPVSYTTQTHSNFSITMPRRWLRPMDYNIVIGTDPNDWIIVNLQQTGYYRVNYDLTNWQKIANYLNSKEYANIHVLNRAQIIDDICSLFLAKYIDFGLFVNITKYLSIEKDVIPWYPMFRGLSKLTKFFPLPESQPFKAHMLHLLSEFFQIIGYEENLMENDVSSETKMHAMTYACIINPSNCTKATDELIKHLQHPGIHQFSPLWENYVFCQGLMTADRNVWMTVLMLHQRQILNMKYLEFLACSENVTIIISYIQRLYIYPNYRRTQGLHHHPAFTHIVEKHARKNPVLDSILWTFKEMKFNIPLKDIAQALTKIILNVYSKEHLDKIEQLLKDYPPMKESDPSEELQNLIRTRWINLQYLKGNCSELFKIRGKDLSNK